MVIHWWTLELVTATYLYPNVQGILCSFCSLFWPGQEAMVAVLWQRSVLLDAAVDRGLFCAFHCRLRDWAWGWEEGHTTVLEFFCISCLLLLPLHRGCGWGAHYASLCLLQLTFGLGLLGLKANAVLDPTISSSMCHVKHYTWIEMMTCPHMIWSRVSKQHKGGLNGPLPSLMSQSAVAWMNSPTSLQILQGNPPHFSIPVPYGLSLQGKSWLVMVPPKPLASKTVGSSSNSEGTACTTLVWTESAVVALRGSGDDFFSVLYFTWAKWNKNIPERSLFLQELSTVSRKNTIVLDYVCCSAWNTA